MSRISEDKEDAEPERRGRKTGDRDHADHQIDRAVLLQGRDRPERDRNHIGDDDRHDRDFERNREARGDLVGDGFARPHRDAEIAPEKADDEIEELQVYRAVHPELGMAGLDCALVEGAAARAEPHHADIPRYQAHQQKNERRRAEQGRDHQQQPPYDVPVHPAAPSCPHPPSASRGSPSSRGAGEEAVGERRGEGS